jgi:hypothetical protein
VITIDEARTLLSLLADRDRIVFEGEAKDRFVDCLESMLGGDPYQEGSAAMEILEIPITET